jgi:hypothetical protein
VTGCHDHSLSTKLTTVRQLDTAHPPLSPLAFDQKAWDASIEAKLDSNLVQALA